MSKFEKNGYSFDGEEDEEEEPYGIEYEESFLTDEMDHAILLHRDIHFGGSFKVMLDYYLQEGIGVNPDFDIERIKYLAEVETELHQNLASLLFTQEEREKVIACRKAYAQFKEIYEEEGESNPIPRLIADLVLTEEEEPSETIEELVKQGKRSVPALLSIIKSQEGYDPLFPGYGYTPCFAIIALGKIKDPETLPFLFECFGKETVFEEAVLLEAFQEIGEEAKNFLLRILKSRPLNQDNIHAAYALTVFPESEEMGVAAFKELQDPKVRVNPLLASYLLCHVDFLKNTSYKEAFLAFAEDPSLPSTFKKEVHEIIREWKR